MEQIATYPAPRVAIWGNMNNLGFSLLRYFRDLGADAYLYTYSNDGVGDLAHFAPESDTWLFPRWQDYIIRLPFPDSQISAVDAPLSWAMTLKSGARRMLGGHEPLLWPVSRRTLRKLVTGWDYILGSGIAPAVLERIDRPLDIFAPYASQIEYLSSFDFVNTVNGARFPARWVNRKVLERQSAAVRKARMIVSFEQELNSKVLQDLGRNAKNLSIPMVYVDESIPNAPPNPRLAEIYARLTTADFSILHHARLIWSKPPHVSDGEWLLESKNSHWLFQSLAEIRRMRPDRKPLIVAVEYGPDVEKTKQLCETLGITDCVLWLDLMPRRDVMWLLSKVDVGIGEFYESPRMIWGGTGWEVMAMARPLIQGFNFSEGEFKEAYGYDEPPFFKVRSREDLTRSLLIVLDDPLEGHRIGRACRCWFDKNNGLSLARRWLELLTITHGMNEAHGTTR